MADITSVFTKPVIYLSYICGILPISVGSFSFAYSTILLLFSVCQLFWTPFVIVEIDHAYYNISSDKDNNAFFTTQRIIMMSSPLVIIVTNVCSKFTGLVLLRKYLPSIYNNIKCADSVFKPPEMLIYNHSLYSIVNVGIICFIIVPIKIYIIMLLLIDSNLNYLILIWWSYLFFGNVSSCCTELQFETLCYSLKLRFSKIVTELEHLVITCDSFMLAQVNNYLLKNEKNYTVLDDEEEEVLFEFRRYDTVEDNTNFNFSDISFEKKIFLYERLAQVIQTIGISGWESKFLATNPNFLTKVKSLHTVYRSLSSAVFDSEYLYQIQSLFSISSLFFIILLDVYFALFGLSNAKLNKHQIDHIFWVIHCLIRFLVLIQAAHSTTFEVKYCTD